MNCVIMDFLKHLLSFNAHITITSAKRTPEQNKAAGGASNSQHLTGDAIDIKPYGSTTYGQLLEYIHDYSGNFRPYDQLILYPTFIHISFSGRDRHQLIDKRK